MIEGLDTYAVPEWLEKATDESEFPLHEILNESLYYPACGSDGNPVKRFAGHLHSFIYVDYSYEKESVIQDIRNDKTGFRGYSPLFMRDISAQDLSPNNVELIYPKPGDGNPRGYEARFMKQPFAIWCVLERNSELTDVHGPARLSFLYICGDGSATYQALYYSNQLTPKVICIIQPGHGFGCNWTDFTDPNKIFARSVLNTPSGLPEYLLYGGWGESDFYKHKSCWPDVYTTCIHFWRTRDGYVGLWKLNPSLPVIDHKVDGVCARS